MVERACDERGQSGFVYAMRRFYAQAPQLLSGANFDLAGAHPRLETGLRERCTPQLTSAAFLFSSSAEKDLDAGGGLGF